jgi:hypothetical protein
MAGLGSQLACVSSDAYVGPSVEVVELTRLRSELMEVPKLSDLVARAMQPMGEPWHSDGLSPSALQQALDSEGDARAAIVEAVLQSVRRRRSSAQQQPVWLSRAERQLSGRPVCVAAPLESLKLGGLWERAIALELAPEAIADVLDSVNPPDDLVDLIRTTESNRRAVTAERARASAARRRNAHELVWGDSEDEDECTVELWFPRAAVVGPAEIGHAVRIVRGNGERVLALDQKQRARVGQSGSVVQVDRSTDQVKVHFTSEGGHGAYWRILARGTVYENHDKSSAVVGYHEPGAFAKRVRGSPTLAGQRQDPDFVMTAPGDDNHLSRQDGYVVVTQEHYDIDNTLWVLTKTSPPGASRGGWMLTQTLDSPPCVACCGSRPLRERHLLQMVQTDLGRINTLKIEECGEPHVDGTYRRMHEASCREHFVNQHGMHLYYVPVRMQWHIGSKYFGNQFDNLVISADDMRFELPGRHTWCLRLHREDQDDIQDGGADVELSGRHKWCLGRPREDHWAPERKGELVIKVISNPEYRFP